MSVGGSRDRFRTWVTVGDVSEYAYCPRAHWYRHHPPPDGPAAEAVASAERGTAFHHRELAARARVERRAGVGWAVLLLGLALLVGAVLALGGWL